MKRLSGIISFVFIVALLRSQSSSTCVPSVSIVMSSPSICIGQSATYTVSGAVNYTFSSNPTSSPTFTSTTGVVSPTTHTSYQVSGTNQVGCTSTTQQVLFVNPLPSISIVASPTMVCVGFPSTLIVSASPSSTAHVYNWAHGGNSVATVVNPSVATTYTAVGSNTNTSCQNTQTVLVKVFHPTFTTTPAQDTSVCMGSSIAITATGATSYSWSGGPSPSFSPVYVVSPTASIVYTISVTSVTSSNLKCTSIKTVSIEVYALPTVTASASPTLVGKGESTTLTAQGASTYYWPSLNQSGNTVVVYPPYQMPYTVIGTDIFGCKDTFSLIVHWSTVPGIKEIQTNSFNVFPNPGDKLFSLDAPGPMIVNLYTLTGYLVKQFKISSSGRYIAVLDDFSPGIYILTGHYEGSLIKEKIVIQR